MKTCLRFWLFLGLALSVRAAPGFLPNLPSEDFATAGLQKLTPEELARLEVLVERYKAGELAEVRQQVETKASASEQEAEKKVAEAETKAKEAETKANEAEAKAKAAEAKASALAAQAKPAEPKPAVVPGKKQPGWFAALLTLNRANAKPEKEEPLESRLTGDFRGWNGNSVFNLEDGTRWVQQNKSESYEYSPVLHSPKVKIRPAAFRGFWLEIEGVNLQVRVVPLDLPEGK